MKATCSANSFEVSTEKDLIKILKISLGPDHRFTETRQRADYSRFS